MKYVWQFGGVRCGCGAGAPQRCLQYRATTFLSFFVPPTPVAPTHGLGASRGKAPLDTNYAVLEVTMPTYY